MVSVVAALPEIPFPRILAMEFRNQVSDDPRLLVLGDGSGDMSGDLSDWLAASSASRISFSSLRHFSLIAIHRISWGLNPELGGDCRVLGGFCSLERIDGRITPILGLVNQVDEGFG